jgi:dTDP-4-dehydrorhamnose 3,5-epimerase-like enzyme
MTDRVREVRMVEIPAHPAGAGKGTLSVIENTELPFRVDRVFTVTGLATGAVRASHANALVYEAITCVRGAISIWTHDGTEERSWVLNTPHQMLEVPPGTWLVLRALEDESAYLVLADHTFAAAQQHYITDFDRFLLQYGAASPSEPLSP